MKIVIDLQGGQSNGSRNRGIGRYSLSIVKAILENKKEHDVLIVLSTLFLDTVELVRNELKDYIEEENIYIYNAPSNVSHININNDTRRKNAEFIRETFIASLQPDIVFITSLFEGFIDDAITSIDMTHYSMPTAVILYDLIPLINPTPYLDNPDTKRWYEEKIEHLKRADLLLCISESSRQEALEYLNFSPESVVNIGTSADSQFKKINLSPKQTNKVLKKYKLSKSFLMYTGGIDHRKNIEGLIRSYALLDESVKNEHQLAIVCSITNDQRAVLHSLSNSVGLKDDELIFTGYIPEDDLIALYNLCKAFIFPSWHEGFGLPALEAMNCDAPVIASNNSSLPEVIGLQEALFDPLNDIEISKKIEQVLSDELFRERLLKHSKTQIKKFSWQYSAKKALKAFENFIDKHEPKKIQTQKPKLAYISPLLPQRSGISDYSSELLPSLAKYYNIDVVTNQDKIQDDWITKNCTQRTIKWFRLNGSSYERVLYHFGNSHFHQYMFDLLLEHQGIVVLHDFYLSHVIDSMNLLESELYYSHGYKPFASKTTDYVWDFPVNKRVLDHAKGIVVHSQNSKKLANKWYGNKFAKDWSVIPHLRTPSISQSKQTSRKKLGFETDSFLVCSFGLLGFTKQNQKLLEAWLSSTLAKDKNSYLLFVGENDAGEYGKNLEKTIKNSAYSSQIKIIGWTDTDTFKEYLNIADIGVQLRTKSRGETSGTVLDCMNYAIPTIINANGSMADIDDEVVYKLADKFTKKELVKALEDLYLNPKRRETLGTKAKEIILKEHLPLKCAKEYFEAIENFYTKVTSEKDNLLDLIINNNKNINNDDLKTLSDAISKNHQYSGEKQLFIDVSQLVTVDSNSGIQRVVKSILNELFLNPPKGYRVEPVYATVNSTSYRYAKKFTYDFLSYTGRNSEENIIDFKKGDIFLGLDLAQHVVISKAHYYKTLRANGVKTYFVVYDLLPILKSQFFPKEWNLKEVHSSWLKVIAQGNGALSISASVKNELQQWLKDEKIDTNQLFTPSYFHLGAEIQNNISSKGLTPQTKVILKKISSKITFLMIGTLEPRKGYAQLLDSFEKLWEEDVDVNLVIVAKEGWLVEKLIEKINTHKQLNKRLFWLQGVSDEYLEELYKASTCLIFASEAEGFGLPLIEAAQHQLPIIVRDIPVFREVASTNAYYFKDTNTPTTLANEINKWIILYNHKKHPSSHSMPYQTWEQSAKQLLHNLG